MKKTFALFAITCMIFAACSKVKQLTNINVDIPYNQQVTTPAASGYPYGTPLPGGGLTLPFPAVPLATHAKDSIAKYGTSTDKLIKVSLNSLALQILSPAGQNFDFMDTIQVYISSTTQHEVLIGHEYGIPKGETTLNLTTDTSVNLKSYFIDDTIYFRLTTHINAVPPSGTQLNIASVFHILANPLE